MFHTTTMARLVTCVALCALLTCVSAVPSATISNGAIIGTTTTVSLTSSTAVAHQFLGIPFAESPPKRFRLPIPASSWTAPLQAVQTKPACLQYFTVEPVSDRVRAVFNRVNNQEPAESEDCLYLNVYTPNNASSEQTYPVLFWIYGGAFLFGDGALSFYDGSSLAAFHNVIVVTHNYRTNVFGFPGSPEIPPEQQNAGLHDTRLALDWVQKNIASFGGDPGRVTIFGESAGAISVKQLVANPPQPLPFQAAILESETSLPATAGLSWDALILATGCALHPSPLQCMQDLPASTIQNTLDQALYPFFPVINSVYSRDVTDAFQSGQAAQVPILIGSNKNEGNVFAWLFGVDEPLSNVTGAIENLVDTIGLVPNLTQGLLDFVQENVTQLPYKTLAEVFTFILHCPGKQVADLAVSTGHPVWRYRFSAAFPNTQVFPDAGAYHTAEIPEVFGTYPFRGPGVTQDQIDLSNVMQAAWARFAHDPRSGPGWDSYSNASRLLADLGGAVVPGGVSLITSASADAECPIIDPYTAVVGL